jgi:acyl-coenzyme A synthetase/AMP-(fatty) acid ligase
VDSQGQPVAREQTGEIVLKGQGLMKGYFGEPEAAQERLRSQGFRTRDMGRVDASGEIALLGRLDDILKIAGHKINPLEVEATLNHHPAVAESAVLGLPDPRGILELELHAFVVLRKSTAPTSSELLAHCRQYLEPYKVPNGIHFCTSFPKSSLGKIQRQLLFAEQAPKFTPPKGDRYASTD